MPRGGNRDNGSKNKSMIDNVRKKRKHLCGVCIFSLTMAQHCQSRSP